MPNLKPLFKSIAPQETQNKWAKQENEVETAIIDGKIKAYLVGVIESYFESKEWQEIEDNEFFLDEVDCNLSLGKYELWFTANTSYTFKEDESVGYFERITIVTIEEISLLDGEKQLFYSDKF